MEVLLVAVQSIDGHLTFHDRPGTSSFASPEDGAHFRATLDTCDCAVLGSATYEADRGPIMSSLGRRRLRVVVTRRPDAYAAEAVPGALEFSDASPEDVVADLVARGYRRCALLGGGRINALFLAAGLVDELVITVEPRLFGAGARLVDGPVDLTWDLVADDALNASTRLLRYRRAATR